MLLTTIPSSQQVAPLPSDSEPPVSASPPKDDCAPFPLTASAAPRSLPGSPRRVKQRAPLALDSSTDCCPPRAPREPDQDQPLARPSSHGARRWRVLPLEHPSAENPSLHSPWLAANSRCVQK